jgi:Uma2 family endonuclease
MAFPTYPPAQAEPPLDPRQSLPTMYDLPSEDPKEPGLPHTFHLDPPQLLEFTFLPPGWDAEQVFTASDLNLYCDATNMACVCERPRLGKAFGHKNSRFSPEIVARMLHPYTVQIWFFCQLVLLDCLSR